MGNLRDDTPASERWRSLPLRPGLTEKMTEKQTPRNHPQGPSQVSRSPDSRRGRSGAWGGCGGAVGGRGGRAQGSKENQPPPRRQAEHTGSRPAFLRQSEHTPGLVITGLLPCFRKKNASFPFHRNIHDPSFSWNFLGLSCHVRSLASALTKAISGLRYFLPAMLKRQKTCPRNLSVCTRPPVAPLLLNGNHSPLVLAVTHCVGAEGRAQVRR